MFSDLTSLRNVLPRRPALFSWLGVISIAVMIIIYCITLSQESLKSNESTAPDSRNSPQSVVLVDTFPLVLTLTVKALIGARS